MYESDIEDFFPSINRGIPVLILNAPVKVAWQQENLYMEAHEPLEEHSDVYEASLPGAVHQIVNAMSTKPMLIDWQRVSYITKVKDGIPHRIGINMTN